MAKTPYRIHFRQGEFELDVEGDRAFVESYAGAFLNTPTAPLFEEEAPSLAPAPSPKKRKGGKAPAKAAVTPVPQGPASGAWEGLADYAAKMGPVNNKDSYFVYMGYLHSHGRKVVTDKMIQECFRAQGVPAPPTGRQNFTMLRGDGLVVAPVRGSWSLTDLGLARLRDRAEGKAHEKAGTGTKPAPKAKAKAKPSPKPKAKPAAKPKAKPRPKPKVKPAIPSGTKAPAKAKSKAGPIPKAEAKAGGKSKAKPAPKPKVKPVAETGAETPVKVQAKPAPKPKAKPQAKPKAKRKSHPKPKAKGKPKPKSAAKGKPAPKPRVKVVPDAGETPAVKAKGKPERRPKIVRIKPEPEEIPVEVPPDAMTD